MDKLYVYADFDWLKGAEPLGVLTHDMLRHSETFSFEYDRTWLAHHRDIVLSGDLMTFSGKQHSSPASGLFGCFSDILPDRWGRTLMAKREAIRAKEEGRSPRKLHLWDYLTGIDDFSRMGALRFKENPDDDFIGGSDKLAIPPLSKLDELLAANQEIELSEMKNLLPEEKWIVRLLRPGSSLGGARPKANVLDRNGLLKIAKFPKINDVIDVGLWEFFCSKMAEKAGINISQVAALRIGNRHHTFLSTRFDRTPNGKRRHFASAMALLGLTDGAGADTGHGYLDMVDFIVTGCTNIQQNLEQLYRRVAYNICIGNADDHFRNHGFLLTPDGWTLAPAYDINPSFAQSQALMVSKDSNVADLNLLFDAHEDYLLDKDTATSVISGVCDTVKNWRTLAHQFGINPTQTSGFADLFDERAASFQPPTTVRRIHR